MGWRLGKLLWSLLKVFAPCLEQGARSCTPKRGRPKCGRGSRKNAKTGSKNGPNFGTVFGSHFLVFALPFVVPSTRERRGNPRSRVTRKAFSRSPMVVPDTQRVATSPPNFGTARRSQKEDRFCTFWPSSTGHIFV